MVGKTKRKIVRRGVRRGNKVNNVYNNDKWSIYHTNIRNLDSRRNSLEAILLNNLYSIVTINETHFHNGRKVTLAEYVSYTK